MQSDMELLTECRNGNENAWAVLVKKHSRLVFSIPIHWGFSRDEASDIFQGVWLDLVKDLPRLRELDSLPSWLAKTCSHRCYHWRQKRSRLVTTDGRHIDENDLNAPLANSLHPEDPANLENILCEAESIKTLRESIGLMPGRCQQMIQMLFFDEPANGYRQVAEKLGIGANSVAAIRQRCLARLREVLEEKGF